MTSRGTDAVWEHFGSQDPYYGVLTDPKYAGTRIDEASLDEFFASGHTFVADVLATVRRTIDSEFQPSRAIDFGCGVGRLAIPLAAVCDHVVGLDVSESMLREGRANCARLGVSNVELLTSDDHLRSVKGTFDLVHSYIVFQHIPTARGMRLAQGLIDHLEEGGVGVLHFTYDNALTRKQRALRRLRLRLPLVHNLINLIRGRPFNTPMMQMNSYNLNSLFRMLQQAGCRTAHLELTDHSRFLGAIVYFQKEASAGA